MTDDDGGAGPELSMLTPPQPPPACQCAPDDGAEPGRPSGSYTQRKRGARSARNLARRLKAGRELSPGQVLVVDLVAKLATHAHNVSLGLFEKGELRQSDGEVKAAVVRLGELVRQVSDTLPAALGEEDDDSGGFVIVKD